MDLEAGLKRGPFNETQISQLIELVPGLDSGQVQWLNGYLTGISLSKEEVLLPPQERMDVLNASQTAERELVWILYGSHTGNCEKLASWTSEKLVSIGREVKVCDMASFKPRDLQKVGILLIIVSTDGEGDPPPQAEELHAFLRSERAPALGHVSYSVLALGDTAYTCFCQTGKDFDAALLKLGAQKITDRVDCDVDYEPDYGKWLKEVLSALGALVVRKDGALVNAVSKQDSQLKAQTVYNRNRPFAAKVLNKINLNGRGSTKRTLHLELDLSGSQLTYQAGDALGVYAFNSPKVVDPILNLLGFSGAESVETHLGLKTLRETLLSDYELTPLTAFTLSRYADLTGSDMLKKIVLDNQSITDYIYGRDILDLLKETPHSLTPAAFISLLRKNSARMYSIASSQRAVNEEVHIAVSVVRYEAYGRKKEGHCSSFVSDRIQEGDEVLVFIDSNNRFKLPTDTSRPIIMVGAGTGVAPFRAFLQEREGVENPGKSWLFFGNRNFTTDFLYQREWLQYLKEGVLSRADVAFSRDQECKIYVQDRLIEHGKEVFSWLEEGAYFYVCGDKSGMAKGVDKALREVVQTHGKMREEKAAEYIKRLQRENRYQTDVY